MPTRRRRSKPKEKGSSGICGTKSEQEPGVDRVRVRRSILGAPASPLACFHVAHENDHAHGSPARSGTTEQGRAGGNFILPSIHSCGREATTPASCWLLHLHSWTRDAEMPGGGPTLRAAGLFEAVQGPIIGEPWPEPRVQTVERLSVALLSPGHVGLDPVVWCHESLHCTL